MERCRSQGRICDCVIVPTYYDKDGDLHGDYSGFDGKFPFARLYRK